MTQDEILAMKAGRDLDTLVALALMEYFWVTHMLQFSAEMEVKWLESAQEIEAAGGVVVKVKEERLHCLKLRELHDEAVPFYSRDPLAADAVWKRLCELDSSWRRSDAAEGCRLQSGRWSVEAATYPEAAAKAALLESRL